MKEICTLLVKLHIIFSRMQRVNQHARPSIIQVGCPTCCYQVCALDHANGGAADLDYGSEHCHRNDFSAKLKEYLYFRFRRMYDNHTESRLKSLPNYSKNEILGMDLVSLK